MICSVFADFTDKIMEVGGTACHMLKHDYVVKLITAQPETVSIVVKYTSDYRRASLLKHLVGLGLLCLY